MQQNIRKTNREIGEKIGNKMLSPKSGRTVTMYSTLLHVLFALLFLNSLISKFQFESEGGGDALAKLISHDENIFFLPSISSEIKSAKDFEKVAHCTISEAVVNYYKTHMGAALSSKSLAKVRAT
jgi:hypothetical protein